MYLSVLRQFIISIISLLFFACSKETETQISFSAINYKSKTIKFSDFVGSKECQSCHPDIYDQWEGSTHANAGGPPTEVRVIAPFNGKGIELKDVIVYPEVNMGIYQFRIVNQKTKIETIIIVEAVVGGGFMYGGGTQTFFAKYPDGTYRFLPFDYSKTEGEWFAQLSVDERWVKINNGIELKELYNWPPHRLLGEVENISNCQQCHGSQIISTKVGQDFDVQFTSLAINCESCHGPAVTHIKSMSGIVTKMINESESVGINSLI